MSLYLAASTLIASEPTWTDKEVLRAIGGTLAVVVPALVGIMRLYTLWLRKRIRRVEGEAEKLRAELKKDTVEIDATRAKLTEKQQEAEELRSELEKSESSAEDEKKKAEKLTADLDSMQEKLGETQQNLASERRRIQRALHKDGQTWTEKVHASAPDFKSLCIETRRTPIISVLNLKGGVGKTTITANLGAALDSIGYRVLLVDLDLQGSLTGLFFPESEQAQLAKEETLIEDFLTASFEAEHPNILNYTQKILPERKSGLVPTSDFLSYAQANLTIRWLLREGNRDPRFLMRRELQLKRITNAYDIVLLDCPPLINVCCVNALAASDYLLIPVLPSKQATTRVPILFQRLKEFRENINPALKVLGVLSNRTHRSEMTVDESNRLTLLRDQSKDVWGEAVPLLETFIRQSVEIRTAEDENRTVDQDGEMFQAFVELAREVESRLPTFCLPAASPTTSNREATT